MTCLEAPARCLGDAVGYSREKGNSWTDQCCVSNERSQFLISVRLLAKTVLQAGIGLHRHCQIARAHMLTLQLQAAIGAKNACAFDLTAACSGFVLGIITAGQYIRTGTSKKVLVVGGDALSRFVDWRDRGEWLLQPVQDALSCVCACTSVNLCQAIVHTHNCALTCFLFSLYVLTYNASTGAKYHTSVHARARARAVRARTHTHTHTHSHTHTRTHTNDTHTHTLTQTTGTCILFGDGCGAMVMSASEAGDTAPCSLLGFSMHR